MRNKIFVLNHKAKGVMWWDFLHEETQDDGCASVELAARITKVENSSCWFEVEFAEEPPAPFRKQMRFRRLEEAKSTLYSYLSPYLFDDNQPAQKTQTLPPPFEQSARAYHRTSHQRADIGGFDSWN